MVEPDKGEFDASQPRHRHEIKRAERISDAEQKGQRVGDSIGDRLREFVLRVAELDDAPYRRRLADI
ncbi:MAG: hypothetical protein IH945_01935 [Armatimonadetes bacterium]|nr:hypothetical protein [Armatimonadota bacterium]